MGEGLGGGGKEVGVVLGVGDEVREMEVVEGEGREMEVKVRKDGMVEV